MAGDAVVGGGDTLDTESTRGVDDDEHSDFFEGSEVVGDPVERDDDTDREGSEVVGGPVERDDDTDRDGSELVGAPVERDDIDRGDWAEPPSREGNGSTTFDPMTTAALPPLLPALSGR